MLPRWLCPLFLLCLAFQASELALKMVPEGVEVQLTDFKSILQVEERNLLVNKLISTFQSAVVLLALDVAKTLCLRSD